MQKRKVLPLFLFEACLQHVLLRSSSPHRTLFPGSPSSTAYLAQSLPPPHLSIARGPHPLFLPPHPISPPNPPRTRTHARTSRKALAGPAVPGPALARSSRSRTPCTLGSRPARFRAMLARGVDRHSVLSSWNTAAWIARAPASVAPSPASSNAASASMMPVFVLATSKPASGPIRHTLQVRGAPRSAASSEGSGGAPAHFRRRALQPSDPPLGTTPPQCPVAALPRAAPHFPRRPAPGAPPPRAPSEQAQQGEHGLGGGHLTQDVCHTVQDAHAQQGRQRVCLAQRLPVHTLLFRCLRLTGSRATAQARLGRSLLQGRRLPGRRPRPRPLHVPNAHGSAVPRSKFLRSIHHCPWEGGLIEEKG